MSLLRLIGKRLVLLHVLVVALLLPTLHLHPQFEHGHDGDLTHKHEVAHADFFPGAHDQGTRESGHENDSKSDSQIGFSGVVTRWFNGHLDSLPGYPVGLLSEQPIHSRVNLIYLNCVRSERSPPILDASHSSVSPRAPPQFSVL
jgi:hypothetical protein